MLVLVAMKISVLLPVLITLGLVHLSTGHKDPGGVVEV
jgi:hypothetical protein